jgi:hypothetical protein
VRLEALAGAHASRYVAPTADLPDLGENGVALTHDVYPSIVRNRITRLGEKGIEVEHESMDLRPPSSRRDKLEGGREVKLARGNLTEV